MAAVRQYRGSYVLRYASPELQNDPEIIALYRSS